MAEKPEKTKHIAFRVDQRLYEHLEQIADAIGTDLSGLIRQIIHGSLRQYEERVYRQTGHVLGYRSLQARMLVEEVAGQMMRDGDVSANGALAAMQASSLGSVLRSGEARDNAVRDFVRERFSDSKLAEEAIRVINRAFPTELDPGTEGGADGTRETSGEG